MLVHQRFAAADRDDRRVGFVGGAERLLQRHLVADGVLVFDDPAASDTGEVAGVQRLQHQHQREVFFARAPLAAHVAAKVQHQFQRYSHL